MAARPAPAPAPQPLTLDIGHFDRWRAARCRPATSPTEFSHVQRLYKDYCRWAEAQLGPDAVPTDVEFERVLREAPKVRFEMLPLCAFGERDAKMGTCANLVLLPALRSVA